MKNSYIGLMVDDSPGLPLGVLAILKSGNCFVPINPIFPNERVRFIIDDCNISILLTDKVNYEKAGQIVKDTPSVKHIICVDDIAGIESKEVKGKVEAGGEAEGGADKTPHCYVIYTSGSTGSPKGVPITHGNIAPLFYYSGEFLHLGIHTRVMQNLSYTFDFGVFEMLTTLVFGGRFFVLNKSSIGDFSFAVYFIHRQQINTLHTTPVFLNNLADPGKKVPSIKLIHLGGERLTGKVVKKTLNVISPGCILWNGYGPTEASINCTFFSLTGEQMAANAEENIPIGHPCDRHEIYILDGFLNPQPIGAAGELCIAGPGLSPGYLNRPELTNQKFLEVRKPFFKKVSGPRRERIYRTGDLARWLPEGNIEFLGRIDYQVKVRGFRIELGEIENSLHQHPGIKEAVVIAREHENGGNYLCAYVVTHDGKPFTISQLREHLTKELPDYMVPAYFIHLERIPLTTNGKTDRKALPGPDETFIDTGVEYVAPGTETEKKLASIWQQLLRLEKIGINADFFHLGGDSILVNRCIARIREELQVEIPLRKFFEGPYIKALAEEIEKQEQQVSSIKPAAREGEIPLSFAQERLWFLQELDADNVAYFVPRVIRMKGKLDVSIIERTFTEIIRRHEILRTTFHTVEGRPVQRIQSPYRFKIPLANLMGLKKEEQEQRVADFLTEEGQRPFDFEYGPLLRVYLFKLTGDEHLFVLTEHHLIHDGWTQGVLLREFIAIFSAYSEGKEHYLPELPIQYADFAIWQRDHLKGDVLDRHLNYWKEKLFGLAPLLELPADRPRPPVISGKGELEIVRLSGPYTLRLKQFSRKNGATLFMTMLAVFKTLLYRYTGVEDLCVGTGVANRGYKEMEGMLGMVINTLPLRTQVTGEISFTQCLHRVKETCLEGYQHEDTPFGKIVEVMQPERNLSYTPLFQVLFSFMDTPGERLQLPGLELEPLPTHNRSAKFDINVVVVPPPEQESEETGETLVEWEYNTDIFDVPTIARLVKQYGRLLEEGLNRPETSISTLPLMSDEELKQVLYEFNDTETSYPREKTIHQLFEEQVEKSPDRIALVGANRRPRVCPVSLTYRQLDEQSNRLAGLVIEKGALANDIVGIMMERSIDLIVGIIGILKAGAAYLPIDADYPKERIDYMLKDSAAKIILTAAECVFNFHHSSFIIHHSNHLAYILYTSGSTGQPKGVVVTHRNVVRLVKNTNFVPLTEETRILQTGAPVFDATTFEIWGSLLNGGQLVLVDKEVIVDAQRLGDVLKGQRINTLWLSAPLFNQLLQQDGELFAPLSYLLVGGDVLSPEHINRVRHRFPLLKIINGYGPTENTTFSTTYLIEKEFEQTIPIGKPIANSTAYIYDKSSQLVPVGVWGELYVGGDGVASGYLNNPELTAEKFIHFHHSSFDLPRIHHSKLYCTGDLVRWLPGGTIEFKGRIDQQVKIRGFRIELGEIEGRLLKHGRVKEAVVIDRKTGNDKYLCAYIVPLADPAPGAAELKTYLSGILPDYMIPSFFVFMERIPLNPNGKIDRKALPGPEVGEAAKECTAPRDAVEKMMAEIWAEVLKPKSPIGIDDNFFDLGGHSLNAALLTTRMHKVFNVKIPLREFLQGGCIREVAEYIKGAVEEKFIFIEPVEEKEYYPLSAAQKRMYILQQLDEESTAYNIPALMTLDGALDKTHLEGVFRQLIRRHESLRTSFITIAGEPAQRIHDHVEFEIAHFAAEEHGKTRTFDLSKAPLMRVGLAKQEEERHLLMVDMHHIITDGTSMELFVKEFMALYARRQLPPLKLQYKDYAAWKGSETEKNALKIQAEYWLKQFREAPPSLDLPLDSPRPVVKSFEGRGYFFEITAAETGALKALASGEGTTLYMALLTLYYIFLSRLTGQEDIVVGTPAAGRSHADLEPIMGMFVNTLALRNNPAGEKNFCYFLKEVNENTLAAFANQDYPYEELVEKASVTRDTGRNPLFDTMLNLRNMDISEIQITGLKMTPFPFEENISKFDLTLRAFDAPSNLRFTFEYCTKLFKTVTIERFVGFFKAVIARATREPHARIAEIEIISEAEKQIILMNFNDTAVQYPRDKTIHGLFEEQVEKTPDRIAVIGSTIETLRATSLQMTYRQLNEQSGRLAGLLIEKGVLADDIVAIKMGRSIELIIGIMGILKSGAAYLPIDPDYPQERIDYMLKDSAAKIQLTAAECVEKYPLNQADCYLLKTTYVFDVSVTELFGWFLGGGRLAILEPGGEKDPQKIIAAVEHSAVTHINFVPSMFNVILGLLNHQDMAALKSLRYIFMAGEALTPGAVRKFKQLDTGILLENLYGPTESTIYACGYSLSGWNGDGPVPIGKPLPNIELSILDKYGHLQPAGIPGELCISGAGTAAGYLNNPELTADKFNRSDRTHKTYIFYKTGDLARWLNDGNIEFLGRIDQQVKIRGFRIELGEIENRLLKHRYIKEAVVIARNFKGDKIICAYIVPVNEGAAQDITGGAELREFLAQALPDYMIPLFFVRLEKIPLNSSGKVNRSALPEPEIQAGHYTAPGSLLEEELVEIWAGALGIEKNCISVDVNLFELGATSLKIIDVAHKVRELYKKDIRVVTLFRYNTIRSLAQYLEQTQAPADDTLYEKHRNVKIDEGKARMNRVLGIMKKKQ
ncbi:MAG: amino acid adenylation domain-containing protein [Candidatus Aminicenantes bacterium]|nr:amino acid adenylation domain-containing protein [Candidatus Aminicenantes bacterium]